MARYIGPVCRLCRREKMKLFLKGERCNTKCPIDKKKFGPGIIPLRRKNLSEFGIQLREKQKVKRYYGLLEKQFKNMYAKADRMPGATGVNLLSLLENRLDNVVYRLGFAESRSQARQVVRHSNILLNGKKMNIPSYSVKENDEISVVDSMKENNFIKNSIEIGKQIGVKPWLSVDLEKKVGIILKKPTREDIDLEVEENLIVEYYSR